MIEKTTTESIEVKAPETEQVKVEAPPVVESIVERNQEVVDSAEVSEPEQEDVVSFDSVEEPEVKAKQNENEGESQQSLLSFLSAPKCQYSQKFICITCIILYVFFSPNKQIKKL